MRAQLQQWLTQMPITQISELAISGADLLTAYQLPPGKWVGNRLDALLHAVVHGQVSNTRSSLCAELALTRPLQQADILALRMDTKGACVHILAEVNSTQDYAKQLAKAGVPEGTVVLAEEQTKGRGRLDHTWSAVKYRDILMSFILRPPALKAQDAPQLAIVTAVAAARTMQRFVTPERVTIKWPNDIHIDAYKVSGILLESHMKKGQLAEIVVGIGINVNNSTADFPIALRQSATSLHLADPAHTIFKRAEVINVFFSEFTEIYDHYLHAGFAQARELFTTLSPQIGQSFHWRGYTGTALGLSDSGALQLRTPDGEIRTIYTVD
jgi:BirA family biotin operon repressor/biotin-[acetyl-CoA-carboxylase] ligase